MATLRTSATPAFALTGLTPLLILSLACFPLLSLFISGQQIFDLAHEFVAYRIGDGLSVLLGEGQYVRPVQGLPTALISKFIAGILYWLYGPHIISASTLQLYSAIFYLVLFVITGTIVAWTWPALKSAERAGVVVMALVPWYVAPTNSLLIAPDYWLGEYTYLITALALLPVVGRANHSALSTIAVGAWAGVAISTKISLLGVLPLYYLAFPRKTTATVLYFTAGCVLAYLLLIVCYMHFQSTWAFNLVSFQLFFYLRPNISQTYLDIWQAIASNPFTLTLFFAALFSSIRSRSLMGLATLAWLLVYVYLVYRRPHYTSVGSTLLSSLFIVCLHLQRLRAELAVGVVAVSIGLCVFNLSSWSLVSLSEPPPPEAANFRAELLYLPDNYWNAATPFQAFAYNGGLALRPPRLDNGRPISDAHTFRKLFGPSVLLGESPYEVDLMVAGLRNGMTLAWTRRVARERTSADDALETALQRSGATTTTRTVHYHGDVWIFGSARVP
ncbi:MAG: hypothetical protein EKK41_20390 [Hyphomicrobiales bacterium]|nr:MAG: hypothetical protein EKK41_20390 [Hyphomicrobiales bacterium]